MSDKLKSAVTAAVQNAVADDIRSPLSPLDVPAGSVEVAATRVAERVLDTPTMQHLTGSEPWYQKRSRWSAIIGAAAVVIAPLVLKYTGIDIGEEEKELVVTLLTTIGGAWAAYLAYRAGTATKPLGR